MAVSQAKLEANRRNGSRGKGPVSQAGKDRSRLNSVTHGLRAKTPVLLDEDPQARGPDGGLDGQPLAVRRRRAARRR